MSKTFRKLADEHRHRVYTYAYYSLRSKEDAEDVTQEVLVRLWQHRSTVEPLRLSGWVMRVTRNAVLDLIRRRRTQNAVIAGGVEVEIAANQVAAGVSTNAHASLETAEFHEALEAALATIDSPYRDIIVMREIQEMTYAEIAEALEMPLGTVKVYLYRGRRMIRDALKGRFQRDAV